MSTAVAVGARPIRLPDGPREDGALKPKVSSPGKIKALVESCRKTIPPVTGMSPRGANFPHPLSQAPITAPTVDSKSSSPFPVISSNPPLGHELRHSLHRRRGSPSVEASASPETATQTWGSGETPSAKSADAASDAAAEDIGDHVLTSAETWESLFNMDARDRVAPVKSECHHQVVATRPLAPKPVRQHGGGSSTSSHPTHSPRSPVSHLVAGQGLDLSTAGAGEGDSTWRMLLSRTIEVDGVGSVGVARLLSEVWKRGGASVVTSAGLWPSVLMSLFLVPDRGGSARMPTPTTEASQALQALYNIAVRPNESMIFAGFLGAYLASTAPAAVNAFQENQVYGAWTPTKGTHDLDLSQWTTFTPGEEWPSLSTTLPSGSGLTPRGEYSPALGLPPIEVSDPFDLSRPASRTGDTAGFAELFAQMEESTEKREAETSLGDPTVSNWMASEVNDEARRVSLSLGINDKNAMETIMPSVQSSPFVSAVSLFSVNSASSNIPSASASGSEEAATSPPTALARTRKRPPTSLSMPTAPFVPPPPMCMFFTSAFRDLQKGKVGVWKGDLVIRGRGGGTFNVLIVGEEGSDHLWQSHTWKDELTYPPEPVPTESMTATMIPVSTLAREGLLPVTMGMVLCNDENISAFVEMVQGLHAEGVGFHLPLPGSGLPIVFLPAKFDAADPLQRLGVAFMSKGGLPPIPPTRTTTSTASTSTTTRTKRNSGSDEPSTKRRRKSAETSDSTTSATASARRRSVPERAAKAVGVQG